MAVSGRNRVRHWSDVHILRYMCLFHCSTCYITRGTLDGQKNRFVNSTIFQWTTINWQKTDSCSALLSLMAYSTKEMSNVSKWSWVNRNASRKKGRSHRHHRISKLWNRETDMPWMEKSFDPYNYTRAVPQSWSIGLKKTNYMTVALGLPILNTID
jgi:hypothetical protein